MVDKEKENIFYKKKFNFSYSSINKMLFSPKLFYKEYVLLDREERTDKHLIEGRVIHCLLFEPNNLNNLFSMVPGKVPSDNIKKVLKNVTMHTDAPVLADVEDFVILDSLKEQNLYQSLKTDESRIAKVKTSDAEDYYKFMCTTGKDVIDQDTLTRCQERVEIIKSNKEVMSLFNLAQTDFELDPIEAYAENKLTSKLQSYKFGLKGIIDYYQINHDQKTITIVDLKTTGKTITDFTDAIDYWNYDLQAAVYTKLVIDNLDEAASDYKILFKFVVIDKYNQVYVFDVSGETLRRWANKMEHCLEKVNYHYTEKKYELPYEFLNNKIVL
tara:strand:+ start:19114 stop:20097 length:984 start_codon:yes stop_codon:yes gene_type:complete